MESASHGPHIIPEPYSEGRPVSVNVSELCAADDGSKWIYAAEMPLPFLAGLVNVALFAASVYRKKLQRQNYVYMCVSSTLLSNVAFLAFHFWNEIESYKAPAVVSGRPPGQEMQLLWTLRHSSAVSLFSVMCGNLSILAYVILDSTYFRKRHWKRVQSASREENSRIIARTLNKKRRNTTLLIIISWFLPLTLNAIAVVHWNCAALCNCTLGARGELCPRDEGCSRVWAPLSTSFIIVNVGLWFIAVISLITMTVRGTRNFRSFTGVSTPSSGYRSQIVPDHPIPREGVSNDEMQAPVNESNSTMVLDQSRNKFLSSSSVFKKSEDRAFRSRIETIRTSLVNSKLRLIVLLTLIFVTCTLPMVIVLLIDVSKAEVNALALLISIRVFVHLYTLLCPFLLVAYLRNLRKALNRFFCAVSCSLLERAQSQRTTRVTSVTERNCVQKSTAS